jgi:hypothetical protein
MAINPETQVRNIEKLAHRISSRKLEKNYSNDTHYMTQGGLCEDLNRSIRADGQRARLGGAYRRVVGNERLTRTNDTLLTSCEIPSSLVTNAVHRKRQVKQISASNSSY